MLSTVVGAPTRPGTALRLVRGAMAALLVVAGLLPALAPSATAAGCHLEPVVVDKVIRWHNVCPGDGGSDGGSNGGSGGPSCELTGLNSFCIGSAPCWMNYPAAVDPTPAELAAKPSDTAVWVYRRCNDDADDPLSGWSWTEDVGPDLATQAQDAYGELAAPAFTIGMSPPGRAVVALPTWFWARTAQPGVIKGSNALGVTAFAEPDHLEVDALGDGRHVVRCPWVTVEGESCHATYERSSADQPVGTSGQRSYTARMRLVYDVHFENNGAPLDLPGLPDDFSSPWVTLDVPVAEIQSVGSGD